MDPVESSDKMATRWLECDLKLKVMNDWFLHVMVDILYVEHFPAWISQVGEISSSGDIASPKTLPKVW